MEKSVWIVNANPILELKVFDSYDKAKEYCHDIINYELDYKNYHIDYDKESSLYFIADNKLSGRYLITMREYKVE